MTSDPESQLFDFAGSKRVPKTEDEQMVTDIHAALGFDSVPLRLRKPPVARPTHSWRHYFPVAAAVVIIIALLGASFSTLVPDGDDGDEFASVPPVVLGLTGQDTGTTPIANTTCDLTGDIPLFSGINESPIDAPSVILTLDRELTLVCNGGESILAEGIVSAGPSATPHVLFAFSEANETLILNIHTGESISIPEPQTLPQQQVSMSSWGQWLLERSTDDATMASIYELETMTETPVMSGSDRVAFDTIASTMFSADGDTVLLVVEDGFFFATAGEEARFLEATLDDEPRQIAVSPIGDRFAISAYSYREGPQYHLTTITMYDAATGNVIQEWSLDTEDRFIDLAFTNDGAGLLFTDHSALYRVSAETPEEEPKVLLEGEGVLGLVLTRAPAVVAISHFGDEENGMPTSATSLINLETGAITQLDGRDFFAGSTLTNMRTTLILSTPTAASPLTTRKLETVDAVTGEPVGEIDYTTTSDSSFGSSAYGVDGNTTIVAFGADSIWRLTDDVGNPATTLVPELPIEAAAVSVSISSDGYIAARTFDENGAWLMLPGSDEWIEIDLVDPEDSQGVMPTISFIFGDD